MNSLDNSICYVFFFFLQMHTIESIIYLRVSAFFYFILPHGACLKMIVVKFTAFWQSGGNLRVLYLNTISVTYAIKRRVRRRSNSFKKIITRLRERVYSLTRPYFESRNNLYKNNKITTTRDTLIIFGKRNFDTI